MAPHGHSLLALSANRLKALSGLRSSDGPAAVAARKRLQAALLELNSAAAAAHACMPPLPPAAPSPAGGQVLGGAAGGRGQPEGEGDDESDSERDSEGDSDGGGDGGRNSDGDAPRAFGDDAAALFALQDLGDGVLF